MVIPNLFAILEIRNSKLMRIIVQILIFLFFFSCLHGQSSKEITIHIGISNGNSLPLSHVTIDNDKHFIADEKGNVIFSTLSPTAIIQISHIGYASIDTIINLKTEIYHEFILLANNYTIDPITISDSQKLLEKNNWWINDIILHEFGFLISAQKNPRSVSIYLTKWEIKF
jgi:hypothetical protein